MNDTSLQIDNRAPATVRVIVSVGRSVQTGNPFKVVAHDTGGVTRWAKEPLEAPGKLVFSEGEEVELSADDARRMVALGFCYYPNAKPASSRPLGVTANSQPPVERLSPETPTSQQAGHDPDDDLGRPIGITQSEPRARAKQ